MDRQRHPRNDEERITCEEELGMESEDEYSDGRLESRGDHPKSCHEWPASRQECHLPCQEDGRSVRKEERRPPRREDKRPKHQIDRKAPEKSY